MHPILDVLATSPFAWLRELLLLYNSGDMDGFDRISKSGEFLKQPLLVAALGFLRQKLCLMTLMEIVFKRSKAQRSLMSFADISRETRVTVEEVEHLVMKALSLGLIKGSIDEVDSTVLVHNQSINHRYHGCNLVFWIRNKLLQLAIEFRNGPRK
jgi:26S proteasome regulatory subunit N9